MIATLSQIVQMVAEAQRSQVHIPTEKGHLFRAKRDSKASLILLPGYITKRIILLPSLGT